MNQKLVSNFRLLLARIDYRLLKYWDIHNSCDALLVLSCTGGIEIDGCPQLAAQILLPFGLLRLSYGVPLNADDGNHNRFLRDDIERFQIAVGVDF